MEINKFYETVAAVHANLAQAVDALVNDDPDRREEKLEIAERLISSLRNGSAILLNEPERFVSPDVPTGFITVIGWFARYEPRFIENIYDVLSETAPFGRDLRKICIEQHYPMVKVSAPEVIREYGIIHINAYPLEVVEDFMGKQVA